MKEKIGSLLFLYRKFGFVKASSLLIQKQRGEEIKVKMNNDIIYLRNKTSDFEVFKQVFTLGHYEIRQLKNLKPKVIIDLGAYIGLVSLYFHQNFPDADIYSVEPEKQNFSQLVKNTKSVQKIHPINKAIWNEKKMLEIKNVNKGEFGFVTKDGDAESTNMVEGITMNELLKLNNIDRVDILKIDIEGAESELFKSGFESWIQKVDCIIIELHDWLYANTSANFFKAISTRKFNFHFKGENVIIIFTEESNFSN